MLRRLAYLLIVLLWLIVMALPIAAFLLAARGELMIGAEQGSHLRLFMINSDEAEGIGIQRVQKAKSAEDCFEGSIRYLLWEGQNGRLNTDYCSCVDPQTGYADPSRQCDER